MPPDNNQFIHKTSEKIKILTQEPSAILSDAKICIMAALILSLATTIFAIAIISFHFTLAEQEQEEKPPLAIANSLEPSVLSQGHISRSIWGARAPLLTPKLHLPVDLVIIAHTAAKFCSTFNECSKYVRSAQNYHLRLGLSDIAYNFLIGGDGNIYEGRGWDCVNNQKNQSISVSFIGNYLYDHLSEEMIDALQELLSEGVELGKLKDGYKVVCHNQTVATLSPGDHVYEVVKKLEHFQEGEMH